MAPFRVSQLNSRTALELAGVGPASVALGPKVALLKVAVVVPSRVTMPVLSRNGTLT